MTRTIPDEYMGLVAVFSMAIVTYLTRVAGMFVMARVDMSPRVEAWMRHIPGCVLVSLIVPELVRFGLLGAVAGALTVILAYRFNNLFLAMAGGVAVVFVSRVYLGF
jgi:uncharacterized membrane protein